MVLKLGKKRKKAAIVLLSSGIFFLVFGVQRIAAKQDNYSSGEKEILFTEDGSEFEVVTTAETVEQFLAAQKIMLAEQDQVLPEKTAKIFSGSHITILHAKKISIKEGGKTWQAYTLQKTVEQAIWENKNIILGDDDVTSPSRQSLLKSNSTIVVTHVQIKEETKNESIPFNSVVSEDDKMGWREKKIVQKGENGQREVKYKVVYNDGKEVSRKILEKNTVKDPVNELVTQGTYVKTGKASTGAASWYAFRGGLFAANPWLPMGSYVKVTNQDNGKSVIVKINDRGPFGNGRIIDLDKVAFQQIASLGAGVANVKMEVVLN